MKSEAYPDALIEEYNELMSAYPEHYRLREEVARFLHEHMQDEATILDIGCGTGETIAYILPAVPHAHIVAIDNDPRMIARLQKQFPQEIASGRIIPVCQDIFTYIKSIAPAYFDAITSSWTIHNFPQDQRTQLLKDIWRTLKPAGVFANMDKYVLDEPAAEQASFDQAVHNLQRLANKSIAQKAIEHEEEDRHPDIIMKEHASALHLQQLGFKEITFHTRICREVVMTCHK